MSINALIAQGGKPIGEDLPQIANMLAQRDQQQYQNNRLAVQDKYAAEDHARQQDQYKQAQQATVAKQTVAETEHLAQVPDDQLIQAVGQFPHVVEAFKQAGIQPDPSHIPAIRQAIRHAHDAAASALGEGVPAPVKLGPDESLYAAPSPFDQPGTPAQPILTGAPKPETFGQPVDMNYNGKPAVVRVGNKGSVQPVPGATPYNKPTAAQAGGAEQLDPQTIHDAAIDVMADPARIRQYATFGQAGQAIRTGINNEKTKILKEVGMTEPQLIRQQAIAKGQIKSTSDLVGMQNAVNAYETLAKGNGQRVIDLANSVNTAGVPLLNSAERLGKLASGSPDAAELMLVLHNYQVEAARIVTQPSLKGQLTDQAIKDLKEVVPSNMTPKQAVRLVNRLNFEFDLRQRGIQGSLDTAGSQITPGFPSQPAAPQAAPASAPLKNAKGWVLHSDKNGNKAYVSPDGKQFEPAS